LPEATLSAYRDDRSATALGIAAQLPSIGRAGAPLRSFTGPRERLALLDQMTGNVPPAEGSEAGSMVRHPGLLLKA
jgi:hypothetical protein